MSHPPVGASSFRMVEHCAELSDSGMSGRQISVAVGRSTTWVSRNLAAYRAASPSLLAAWRDGLISNGAALRAAVAPADLQAARVSTEQRQAAKRLAAMMHPKHAPRRLRPRLHDIEAQRATLDLGTSYNQGAAAALDWVLGRTTSPPTGWSPVSGAPPVHRHHIEIRDRVAMPCSCGFDPNVPFTIP